MHDEIYGEILHYIYDIENKVSICVLLPLSMVKFREVFFDYFII